jgi:hypothetical protein
MGLSMTCEGKGPNNNNNNNNNNKQAFRVRRPDIHYFISVLQLVIPGNLNTHR